MKQLRIIVVALALLVMAWIAVSTFAVQGHWQGSLQRPHGAIPFRLHIQNSRSGSNGWLSVDGGSARMLDTFHVKHHTVRFDLTAGGHTYHLQGSVAQHVFNGEWVDDKGGHGTWRATRVRP